MINWVWCEYTTGIEVLRLYIIGRCKSNDEQLAYIETRIDSKEGLKTGLHLNAIDEKYESIILNDSVRLFKGRQVIKKVGIT